MNLSTRKTYFALTATSVGICLFALVMVLSIGSPELDNTLAFLGGFGGTIFVGLSLPWSRRHLLEPFEVETELQPLIMRHQVTKAQGRHLYAPVRRKRQYTRRSLKQEDETGQLGPRR